MPPCWPSEQSKRGFALADTTKLLLLGGAAAAVYWFYFRQPAHATSPVATAPPPPDPNAIKGANSADGIYAQLVTAAQKGEGTTSLNVDQWNYYLAQVAPQLGAPPNPADVFGSISGFSHTQLLSPSQYWAVMAPWLKTNRGLSGVGLMGRLAWGW